MSVDNTMNATSPRPEKYPLALRLLHWIMALAILAVLGLGVVMVDLDKEDPLRATLFGLHKSIGTLVILALVVRLGIRWRLPCPELTPNRTPWERFLAQRGHRALYLLMAITPLVGWAHSDLHGRGVLLFGVPMPKLFPTVEGIGRWPGELHGYLAYGLLSLIVLHVAAVLKHRYIDRECVLERML